jgi:hypothetical protein
VRLLAILLLVCSSCALAASVRPANALPPQQFRARANALCVSYYADMGAIAKRLQPHDLASLVRFQQVGHARAARFVRQLKRVAPPQSLAAQFGRFVALLQQSNALDGPLVAAAKRGDASAVARLAAREVALNGAIKRSARRMSLKACANPPR